MFNLNNNAYPKGGSNQNQSPNPQDSYFNISNSPAKMSFSSYYNSPQASPMHMNESGRRPSGNMQRISFLYNNSLLNNNNNLNNNNIDNTLSSGNNSNTDYTPSNTPPKLKSYNSFSDRSIFFASNEILACDRSWETPNLVAIATPRNLQLLKVSNTDITLETELTMKPVGRTKISTISDLAFGHQQYGRYLAASTITGSIHLYHFDRGTRVKSTLNGHNRSVNSIDFNYITPHLLASGSQDGKILIWDLKASNLKPSMTLNCNADAVRCCSFNNKKSNILAAVFDSGVVEKWDLRKNNTWEKRINAHTGPALSVHWHPELDYIVTGGRDKQLQVWNLESGFETREPSHVINTSGPIFKAKWCKGRGNNSIMNTDIAVSFFNDDPCVQIWNLNRKFIPKTIIDGHSAQITQIVWRTPKQLITCSKDKTLIQYDVTKEPEFIDNVKNGAFAWNPNNPIDFTFVKQEKSQFEGPFTSSRSNIYNELNAVEEIDLSNNNTGLDNFSSTNNKNINININNNTTYNSNNNFNKSNFNNITNINESGSSMQVYEMPTSKSPSSHSPTLSTSFKHQRQQIMNRQPSYIKPISCTINNKNIPPPAWITNVRIPLTSDNNEKFEFLSTHYIIRVPDDSDIIEVCEFNSNLAASVGYFRDSQTWRTIKTAILLDNNIKNSEDIESKLNNFAFEKTRTNSFGRSDSHLGTSFGSDGDLQKNKASELSLSYGSETYLSPNHENTVYNENAIVDDDDDDEDEEDKHPEDKNPEEKHQKEKKEAETNIPEENQNKGKEKEEYEDNVNVDLELSERVENTTEDRNTDLNENLVSHPSPINIEKVRKERTESQLKRYRYSFTGSSVDMDDEKSGSPLSLSLSLSCSPLVHKSRSRLLLHNSESFSNGTPISLIKTSETHLSRVSDNRSQLTAIMKDSKANSTYQNNTLINENEEINSDTKRRITSLKVPWNPTDMIRESARYSSEQGNILMCATLALLFEKEYPDSILTKQAEEWIYLYHDYLLRCGYFNNAATVLRISSELHEEFKTIGQTKTSVRALCCHCMKPILNEESKEKYKESLKIKDTYKISFGFWYCDKCRKLQGGCCYCCEPIKGNTVALVQCGHEGHFGCFRSWFIDQGESECPACGKVCVN
jgi:WD40 repeat protein